MRRWRWFSICGLAIGISLMAGCLSTGYRSTEERYPNGSVKAKSRSVQAMAINGDAAVEAVSQAGVAATEAANAMFPGLGDLLKVGIGLLIAGANGTYHSRKRNKVREEEYRAGLMAGAGQAASGAV